MLNNRANSETPILLILLWLSGVALRITVLAVPPVIPLIHRDLHLSQAGVGLLTALPSLLFAAAAVPGSLLVSRLGPVRALIVGLLITAVAAALRGTASHATILYGTTFFMGAGIAVMQPTLPRVVRDWLPHRIGFGTAVYSNGLLVGELLSVSITGPYLVPLLGGSWRLGLVVWALPVFAIALLVMLFAPRQTDAVPGSSALPAAWWPDWKNPLIWRLGFILGCVNTLYFGTNFFLPDYLHHTGRPEMVDRSLTALNLYQLPASIVLLAFAGKLTHWKGSYIASGLLLFLSLIGVVFAPGGWVVFFTGIFGFFNAALFILILALPPLLTEPQDVHRVSAGMFTISYSCAVAIPIVSGLLWDITRVPLSVFLPIGLCSLIIIALSLKLSLAR
jgi:MFS transporter, CP family, cyanate transporter